MNAAAEATNPQRMTLLKRFSPILLLVGLCWVLFVLNNLILGGHLTQFGIRPRHLSSLPGILFAPFLHVSFHHLAANTPPLLILGAVICARSKREFALVTLCGIILGGSFTWLIGRSAYHVGASGLIFCYFGYLASLAFFERKIGTLLLSLLCLVGYGGLLRGMVPTSTAVSWEGHVAGFLAGITLAWLTSELKHQTPAVPAQAPAPPQPSKG
jgi:membrane associated rhomboid family serine protease